MTEDIDMLIKLIHKAGRIVYFPHIPRDVGHMKREAKKLLGRDGIPEHYRTLPSVAAIMDSLQQFIDK